MDSFEYFNPVRVAEIYINGEENFSVHHSFQEGIDAFEVFLEVMLQNAGPG
jgi:hypothetical protein